MGLKPDRTYETLALRSEEITVEVTRAPIEHVIRHSELDAIVSSDDANLSMGGGVSSAIRDLAGAAFAAEARKLTPLQIGDVRVTSAGALPLKYVLHAVTVDWARGILPSARTVRHLAREIFVRCEALEIRRIVIPALGVGNAKIPALVSARELARTLLRHAQNSSVLERVIFSIPDADAYRCFVFELMGKADRPGQPADLREAAARSKVDRAEPPVVIERSFSIEDLAAPEVEVSKPTKKAGWITWPATSKRTDRDDFAPKLMAEIKAVPAPGHAQHECRPLIGERYVLLEEIGRGGLGVVHLAWDLILRRVVAIKKLRDDIAAAGSLKREAAIAMDLTHEGIVRVHHFEPRAEQGGPYLVMEYLPWSTGEAWVADAGEGGLPVAAVLDVGTQVCRALDYAHGRGVLHLDIKPGNLFVDPAGESTKLADFGIARVLAVSGHRALQLEAAGTPAYMAPEQMVSGGKLSPATDIYQLAASLWDFLTGHPPTGAADEEEGRETDRGRALRMLRPVLALDQSARPSDIRSFARLLTGAMASL